MHVHEFTSLEISLENNPWTLARHASVNLNRRKTFIRNKFLCGTKTRLRMRPNPYVHAVEP